MNASPQDLKNGHVPSRLNTMILDGTCCQLRYFLAALVGGLASYVELAMKEANFQILGS